MHLMAQAIKAGSLGSNNCISHDFVCVCACVCAFVRAYV